MEWNNLKKACPIDYLVAIKRILRKLTTKYNIQIQGLKERDPPFEKVHMESVLLTCNLQEPMRNM